MSLFMVVEETGSLMGVDIQSAADDVLEKWMEVCLLYTSDAADE